MKVARPAGTDRSLYGDGHAVGRTYFYKLTVDDDASPCVQSALPSLVICEPFIRASAEPGAVVFGSAADRLDAENALLYIAAITNKCLDGHYYEEARFAGGWDCIYARRGAKFVWRGGAFNHDPEDVIDDLGPAPGCPCVNVLLSEDFRYLGNQGTRDYKTKYPLIERAIERLSRGHPVNCPHGLRAELLAFKDEVWRASRRKVMGQPLETADRRRCHRNHSCGVVEQARSC